MTLGEKLKYLREVEGSLRGWGRPMKQQEIVLRAQFYSAVEIDLWFCVVEFPAEDKAGSNIDLPPGQGTDADLPQADVVVSWSIFLTPG